MMKRACTIVAVLLVAGALSACGRAHLSKSHGVAYRRTFAAQEGPGKGLEMDGQEALANMGKWRGQKGDASATSAMPEVGSSSMGAASEAGLSQGAQGPIKLEAK